MAQALQWAQAHIADMVGWAGMITLLIAFARQRRLKPRVYCVMNLIGAAAVGYVCLVQRAWPALGLEVAWCGVALYQLVNLQKAEEPRR